jgi:hypothetical protein
MGLNAIFFFNLDIPFILNDALNIMTRYKLNFIEILIYLGIF